MDDFLDYLIKKSDPKNNEYFNYRQPQKSSRERQEKPAGESRKKACYTKILEPSVTDYVVFDFETTGMKAGVNNITEIGAVKVTDSTISGVFNTLVNPEQFIPYYIVRKTHITNEMVADKKTIEEVLPDFIRFIGDYPLIAHNAPFDMSFLLRNASDLGIEINNPVLDTLYLSRRFNKECEKHSLEYLTGFFKVEHKNAHRAYADALATNQIYRIIQKKYNDSLE